MPFIVSELPKSVSIQKHLTNMHIDKWIKYDVFSWKWWILLCLFLVIIIIWWTLVEKSKASEICLFALIATVMFMGVHEYGEELTLWGYPIDIIPIFPPVSSINLLALSLSYSIVYQFFKSRNTFLLGTLIITATMCFIIEPILSLGRFYHLYHWKYYYSFILYTLIAVFIRIIVLKIIKITEGNRY